MKIFKFNTNINCGGCVANVRPYLNSLHQIKHWEVDTINPNKVLTIESDEAVTDKVITVLKNAGYRAELIE
jgi:copper chaperone